VKTIGIDLGGTKMSAGLVDESGAILEKLTVARPVEERAMADRSFEMVEKLLSPEVAGIGLGAAGLVTWPEGSLAWGPNIPGRGIPFKEIMQARYGLPAVVDNDANLAALAEFRLGAARGHSAVLLVTLGTGIGGGLLIGGSIYRGASFAGEVGHMVVDVGGPSCTCGQRGCWETFASGRRLDQLARDLIAAEPDGLTARLAAEHPGDGTYLTEAAVRGDARAREAFAEMGSWLGIGLASLIAVLDPELIVIGGGAARAGDILLEPARRSMMSSLEGAPFRNPTPVVAAALGEDAGLIGAALAAGEAAGG